MNTDTTLDYRNSVLVRRMGMEALTKELGTVGMTYFLQQFDRGEGNYTSEREKLLSDLTMDGALRELAEMRRNEFI